MKVLDDRLIQSRPKLTAMSVERGKDQKEYYDSGRHDYYSLLDNQIAIMEALNCIETMLETSLSNKRRVRFFGRKK
jgi:hypothetical protein